MTQGSSLFLVAECLQRRKFIHQMSNKHFVNPSTSSTLSKNLSQKYLYGTQFQTTV